MIFRESGVYLMGRFQVETVIHTAGYRPMEIFFQVPVSICCVVIPILLSVKVSYYWQLQCHNYYMLHKHREG